MASIGRKNGRTLLPVMAVLVGLTAGGCATGASAASPATVTVTATVTPTSRPAPAAPASPSARPTAAETSPAPRATAPPEPVDPTYRGHGFVIPRRDGVWDWKNATYPSTCLTWDQPPISRHLHGGVASLPYDFDLRLGAVHRARLNDGHTYTLVALNCEPGAGKSLTQIYAFAVGVHGLTYLGQPVRFRDDVALEVLSSQDGEGFVVSAYGWTERAPDCCPDQESTFFISVSPDGVTDVGRQNEPIAH